VAVDGLARTLVSEHLDALSRGHMHAISKASNSTEEELRRSLTFIRTRLRPYPIDDEDLGKPVANAVPSIAFCRRHTGFVVDVGERARTAIALDPFYASLASGEKGSDPSTREHALHQVATANAFLSRVRRRWDTLQRLGEVLAREQEAFLR